MNKRLNHGILFVAILMLGFQLSCVRADADKQPVKSVASKENVLTRAKQITIKYKLSMLSIDCIQFEENAEKYEGMPLIDARELHSKACGGDPATSPRLFSIGFDASKGEVWSDAKSLVGQMELIGKE